MEKQEFLKRYVDWVSEMFLLGAEAENILRDILNAHNGAMFYGDLYGETDNPEWIYLEGDSHLHAIYYSKGEIQVEIESNDCDTRAVAQLDWLSPDDRMSIAQYLLTNEG